MSPLKLSQNKCVFGFSAVLYKNALFDIRIALFSLGQKLLHFLQQFLCPV